MNNPLHSIFSSHRFTDSATELDKLRAHIEFADMIIEAVEIESSELPRHSLLASTGKSSINSGQTESSDSPSIRFFDEYQGFQATLKSLLPTDDPCSVGLSLLNGLPNGGRNLMTCRSLWGADSSCFQLKTRGTVQWAPPRLQLIFTEHDASSKSSLELIEQIRKLQNGCCAGCGIAWNVSTIRIRKALSCWVQCQYFGKYFCKACICSQGSYIPSKILNRWDFHSNYHICRLAKTFLDSIFSDPLFNLRECPIFDELSMPRELRDVHQKRQSVAYAKKLIENCPSSNKDLTTKAVQKSIDDLHPHLTSENDIHMYSLDDLFQTRSFALSRKLQAVLRATKSHVVQCHLCQSKGNRCPLCRNKTILFRFDDQAKIWICQKCKRCFHRKCVEKRIKQDSSDGIEAVVQEGHNVWRLNCDQCCCDRASNSAQFALMQKMIEQSDGSR